MEGEETNKEHVVRYLDSIGAHPNDVDLCPSELYNYLTDRAYTSYMNMKSGLVCGWEHIVSLFNMKFFCAKTKLTVVELHRVHQYPRDNAYVKRLVMRKLRLL